VNQVAGNRELFDIAKDYLQFVTKFFEVINASAAHIYHSALELCPTSSIIRKLYYHQRTTCSPKVVIGTPKSWNRSIAVSSRDQYNGRCIWSPCGQFVAARTKKTVEIRNQLTLELITTLQPTETIRHLVGPLAYAPDGRSIACASDTTIIIWDIQTGGVAKETECSSNNILLVWSEDGRTLCTIDSGDGGTFIVHIYDASSGTASSPGILESGNHPHLWTVGGSFRAMTTVQGRYPDNDTINVFKVESTLTRTESFTFPPSLPSEAKITSFSPTTCHVSISDGDKLWIFDIQKAKSLLAETDNFLSHCFSSGGDYFAASQESGVHLWKYVNGHYSPWREFQCQGWSNPPLQFSPDVSSILGHSGDTLHVWRLFGSSTAPEQHYVGLSRLGTHVVTAFNEMGIVTITEPLTQTPLQFIDPGVGWINGLVLTGNVLLVAGFADLRAWLLTEEGVVDGVIGGRQVGRTDSIWTISQSRFPWTFRVEGQVGVINPGEGALRFYHTETGEVLHPTQAPQHFSSRWYHFFEGLYGRDYFCYHNLSQCDTPPEDSWQTSRATVREGWVKDPEGKHRLWVPFEWRTDWDRADWREDVTTQFSYIGGRPIIIKF
jgi:hypothetical protein